MSGNNLVLVKERLEEGLPEIQAAAISRAIDPARLIRIVMTVAQDEESKIAHCTPQSFMLACLNAAAIGLEPTGLLGDAYLVPYKKICTLQIGYKGLIKLMKRTGEISRVEAHEVWDCDHIKEIRGTEPRLEHEPGDYKDRQEMVAAYAIAFFRDGSKQFEVMTPDEIAAVRKKSRGSDHELSPWNTFEAMMWRKSALRRLSNYIELSASDRAAIAYDDQVTITGEALDYRELNPETIEAASETSRVASEVKIEEVEDKLESASEKAAIRREIGAALQGMGYSFELVGDFAQTTFSHREALLDKNLRVNVAGLSKAELEELKKAVEMAALAHEGGQAVILESWQDPGEQYELEPVASAS